MLKIFIITGADKRFFKRKGGGTKLKITEYLEKNGLFYAYVLCHILLTTHTPPKSTTGSYAIMCCLIAISFLLSLYLYVKLTYSKSIYIIVDTTRSV